MKYINLDFIKPDKDCVSCDHNNDYTCFSCEDIQVRKKYPKAIYTTDVIPPEWYTNEQYPQKPMEFGMIETLKQELTESVNLVNQIIEEKNNEKIESEE